MKETTTNLRKTRQKYSPQFKDQALERAAKNGIPQTAKDLGIRPLTKSTTVSRKPTTVCYIFTTLLEILKVLH